MPKEVSQAMVEAAIGRNGWPEHPEWACERNRNGDYASTKVQGAWEGWNAALDRAEEPSE